MTTILERFVPETTEGQTTRRWIRRPVGAAALRTTIVLLPIVAAIVVGLVVGRSVGGRGVSGALARIGAAGAASALTIVILDRVGRRILPLAMLMRLSLVFPDHAPSRFSVAMRSTSVKKLQLWARMTQHDDGPAALAEKVVTLAAALNTHDRRTRGHSDRSRAMAELLAVEMGLSEAEVNEVRWGAFLHDIGKILVPSALLNKAGKPTPSEWETLKRHPGDGGNLVEPLRGFLGSGVEAVSEHHENYDGSGYPRGLAGSDIALSARIVSVADSFEVMTAVRSYSMPMKASEARKELARHSGSQFDPAVVRSLLGISLGRLHWSLGLAAWLAELPFLGVLPRAVAQAGALTTGPTVSVGTLSTVAAISLGSMVVQVPLTSVPANATISPASGVVAQGQDVHHPRIPGMATSVRSLSPPPVASTDGQPTTSSTVMSGGQSADAVTGGPGSGANAYPNASAQGANAVGASQATDHAHSPQPATPTLPPQAVNHPLPPVHPSPPPQAATPSPPPQAADPSLPPQANNAATANTNPHKP